MTAAASQQGGAQLTPKFRAVGKLSEKFRPKMQNAGSRPSIKRKRKYAEKPKLL